MDLVPCDDPMIADDLPIGSGEGLIDVFFDLVDEVDSNGKTKRVKKQTRARSGVPRRSGRCSPSSAPRKGRAIAPMLRTGWSGQTLGTTNASIETRRRLPAGRTPSGSSWASNRSSRRTSSPTVQVAHRSGSCGYPQPTRSSPTTCRPHPAHSTGSRPTPRGYSDNRWCTELAVDPAVANVIRRQALEVTRGDRTVDALDEHAHLARLKVAGILAILDDRLDITPRTGSSPGW